MTEIYNIMEVRLNDVPEYLINSPFRMFKIWS